MGKIWVLVVIVSSFVIVKEKVIILGWTNDENTLRTYGKKTDAYTVFSKMLKEDILLPTGNPHPETEKTVDGVHNARQTHSYIDQRAPFLTPRPESLQPSLSQSFQTIAGMPSSTMIMSIR